VAVGRRRVRSALFTPGTEAAWLRAAVAGDADACIFDLEDAVTAGRIEEARQIVADAAREVRQPGRVWVRVHAAASHLMPDDLRALPLSDVGAVMVPKVDGPADLQACRSALAEAAGGGALALVPLIESAAGALSCPAIATEPQVVCLAFGRFDLAADLGVDPDHDGPALVAARGRVILASRAAGLPPPLDAPWVRVKDLDGLRAAAERSRQEGFGGMLAIHPTHIPVIHDVFRPSGDEVRWAKETVDAAEREAAAGRGAFTAGGNMVDEAMVRRARRILEEA